jgi:hypothetical protein
VSLVGWAAAGCHPATMGLGPVPAVQKLFARTGLGCSGAPQHNSSTGSSTPPRPSRTSSGPSPTRGAASRAAPSTGCSAPGMPRLWPCGLRAPPASGDDPFLISTGPYSSSLYQPRHSIAAGAQYLFWAPAPLRTRHYEAPALVRLPLWGLCGWSLGGRAR